MRVSSIDSDYCLRYLGVEPGQFSTEYLVKFLEYTRKGELKEASALISASHVDLERKWVRIKVWDIKDNLARISMVECGSGARQEFDVLLENIVKNSDQ